MYEVTWQSYIPIIFEIRSRMCRNVYLVYINLKHADIWKSPYSSTMKS